MESMRGRDNIHLTNSPMKEIGRTDAGVDSV